MRHCRVRMLWPCSLHILHGRRSILQRRFAQGRGNLSQGFAYYDKASIISWAAFATGYLGWTYHDMGSYEKAKAEPAAMHFDDGICEIVPILGQLSQIMVGKS